MNLKPLLISACLLTIISPVFAGVQTAENTRWIGGEGPNTTEKNALSDIDDNVTRVFNGGFGTYSFGVEDRSVWGPSAPSSSEVNFELTAPQWDSVFGRAPRARVGVGAIEEVCIPVAGCAKAGAAAGIELEAYILPYVNLEFDAGTFDARVDFAPTAKYQSTGLGLDFSRIETTTGESGGALTLDSPSFSLETGVKIDSAINLFVEACLGGCFIDEKSELVDFDPFTLPLVTLDTGNTETGTDHQDPVFEVFYPDLTRLDEANVKVGDLFLHPKEALLGAGREAFYLDAADYLKAAAEGKVEDNSAAAGQLEKMKNGPLGAELTIPWASPDGTITQGLSGSFGGPLLAVNLDIDQVIGYAFGFKNGLEFDLQDFGVPDEVSGKVVLGDATAGPVIDLQTEVSLNPELMVDLQFDSEVYIAGKIGKQTSYQGSWEDLPAIGLTSDAYILRTNEAGETESPDDKTVTATPEFSIQATLDNRTYLDLKAQASLDLFSAEVDIQGDGLPGFSIGPVLEYNVESESLGQLDIFNNSFAVTGWDDPVHNTSDKTTDKLEFNAFGEIIFQARGPGQFDEFYDKDARINQSLSTKAVINAQVDAAGESSTEDNIYIYTLFNGRSVFNNVQNELKIDNRTAAHVMVDGSFTNDANLTIEQGGNLELGKANPYEERSLANDRLASSTNAAGGFVNESIMQVYGEVFSNAIIENPSYVFENASNAELEVGASGRVKFDGTFINKGSVNNYGSIELTGESNLSSKSWDNEYGSELDLYGILEVSGAGNALSNSGVVRLHGGAKLVNHDSLVNFGHLNIESGAELRSSDEAGAGSELLNLGTVSNSGYVLNNKDQLITNGTSGLAFTSLIGSDGLWDTGSAYIQRNASLKDIDKAYGDFEVDNDNMQNVVKDNRNKRIKWLGTNNQTDAKRDTAIAALQLSQTNLDNYRKSGGVLDKASALVASEVETMTASGFAVWENLSGGLLVNEGSVDNNAVMVNHMGGSVFNSGTLDNQGYVKNVGKLVNNSQGTDMPGLLVNAGRIDNGDKLLGLAGMSEMVNLGKLNNRGELVNHDTLVNYGELDNSDNGTGRTQTTGVQNNGSLTNVGTLENQATYTNARGAETNNYGVINNAGVLDNHGFINNGVKGSSAAQTDITATTAAAGGFYGAIQQLTNDKQDLENINQQYENEAARLRRIGFMGMLNEGEPGANTEAWATYLYEKYLVSNLAFDKTFRDSYSYDLGSLEKDKQAIKDYVTGGNSGATVQIEGDCQTAMLACYKYFYGNSLPKQFNTGGDSGGINYAFPRGQTDSSLSIQALNQYKLNEDLQNNGGDDENRFLWTLLMMMDAEGVTGRFTEVLNCAGDGCQPTSLSGNDKSDFYAFFDGYSEEIDASDLLSQFYAEWTDAVVFNGKNYYKSEGFTLSLTAVSSSDNPAAKLAGLYQDRLSTVESINDTISSNSLATLGFNTAAIPDFQSPENVDVRALLSGLGTALRTASFDLAAVTSLDAQLNNTGTINNRGVINNRANLNNEESGVINNSGALIIGATGTLTNAGDVILDAYEFSTGDVQSGFLISHGTIDNEVSGLIDIRNGTLLNGSTANEEGLVVSKGVINNYGDIKLSGSAEMVLVDVLDEQGNPVTDPSTGDRLQREVFNFSTANLINEGTLNNFAGALLQVGQNDPFMQENRLNSLNVLINSGDIYNDGTLANYGTLRNAGLIDNRAGSRFINKGLLNNTTPGVINFANSAALGGDVTNNGLISMTEGEVLTLTGHISGNGTFAGSTLLNGATVNPGNSPGLLTFNGDVSARNVNWVMEIWGTDRGLSYDAIDIIGDFNLNGDMSLSILSLLDFDTLVSQEFSFFDISGDLFDAVGSMVTTSFDFVGFSDEMEGNWSGNWIKKMTGGWSLNLAFVGDNIDIYDDLRALARVPSAPTDVAEPGTIFIFMTGLLALWWRSIAGKRRFARACALQWPGYAS
jgi:hypothetical protein